jgi:hypothetical protein
VPPAKRPPQPEPSRMHPAHAPRPRRRPCT